MKFQKGHLKRGGRQKGVPNKDKATVRQIIEGSLGKSIPERMMELAGSNPREQMGVLIELLPYTYSKLQSVELSGDLAVHETNEEVKEIAEWLRQVKEKK